MTYYYSTSTSNSGSSLSNLSDIIQRQTTYPDTNIDYFFCRSCKSWQGGCSCKKNFFVAVEGANTSNCIGYEKQ